jgi:micrococcal nuclease
MRRLSFLFCLLLLLGACSTATPVDLSVQAPATFNSEPGGFEEGRVTRVVDGDTIEVEILSVADGPGAGDTVVGYEYDVRFLGIDTPESVKPGSPVECFGREASNATKALLEGQTVRLVKDVEDEDRFGRILRYVYLGDELANARLVVNGYASVFTYPPNVRHADLFVQLERDARENDRGLWSPDSCNGVT